MRSFFGLKKTPNKYNFSNNDKSESLLEENQNPISNHNNTNVASNTNNTLPSNDNDKSTLSKKKWNINLMDKIKKNKEKYNNLLNQNKADYSNNTNINENSIITDNNNDNDEDEVINEKEKDIIIKSVNQELVKKKTIQKTIDVVLKHSILDNKSKDAELGRFYMMLWSGYGEFSCSFLFYFPIFCCITHGYRSDWNSDVTALATALVAGFQAIGISFMFSSISGAQFNSAISFGLWCTGKLSNRRCLLYIFAQLSASIVAAGLLNIIYCGRLNDEYDNLAVTPNDDDNLYKVFATEYLLTFLLTYTAFMIALEDAESNKKENMSVKSISDSKGLTLYTTTPQSKTGFAPFSIGFVIFALSLVGGTGGSAFNPGRLFGPAIFSGKWHYIWLYFLGEFLGGASAALVVHYLHIYDHKKKKSNDENALKVITYAIDNNNNNNSLLDNSVGMNNIPNTNDKVEFVPVTTNNTYNDTTNNNNSMQVPIEITTMTSDDGIELESYRVNNTMINDNN